MASGGREIQQPQPDARRPAPAIQSQRPSQVDRSAPGRAQRVTERLAAGAEGDAVDPRPIPRLRAQANMAGADL
jgi:hypothetical protein